MMNCGIYEIRHVASGKRYVGSSQTIKKRWKEHRGLLRRGTHHSPHLQAAWNKYGAAAFEHRTLLVCAPSMLLFYEQLLLDSLHPEFNVLPTAGSCRGHRVSESAKRTMGAAQRRWRPKYEWKGQQLTMTDIAELEGIDAGTLMARVMTCGMTIEQAVAKGESQHRLYEHQGRALNITGWAAELGMHPRRLTYWLAAGMSIADCIARLNREAKAMSLQQFVALSSIPYQTARSRMKRQGIGEAVIQHLELV